MVRAAQQEAAAILDRARAQAETLLAEKRRSLERKKTDAEAKSIAEVEREAEQLLEDARTEADALKGRCMGKMDEAVELVLKRIVPGWKRTADSE
ncbi:V-type ATPase subunit subunit G family protein [Candidatus Nitrospira bockiana]